MKTRTASLLVLSALLSAPLLAQQASTAPSLAQRYRDRLAATLDEKATAQDVDDLLSLYAENVIYEHPRVGARIEGKEQIRAGMNGFLGTTRHPTLRIKNEIEGRGVIVLELDLEAEAKRGESWEPLVRTQVLVLETDGDRILRIIDHW